MKTNSSTTLPYVQKDKHSEELMLANKALAYQNQEKENRAHELRIANKELAYQNKEKEKRADELAIANKELAFQNEEKEKRAAELIVANEELLFQNGEKEKRADELVIANKELAYQNKEKEKRAAELIVANEELLFQNGEKEKRADELVIANKELAYQNKEKEKRAAELIVANEELLFQNGEKEKRADELVTANKELVIQSKARRKSDHERKKSDDLLLNILPAEVADELKINGTTKARHFDNVTVLFTDFVNFTNASERMKPQALIDELHSCFKAFDEITAKYNIEKIKTNGDAYLAVAGLPSADDKHAENVVQAAIEISAFMRERLAKMGDKTFEIRIGIHSGSVVAGIVGVKKFAYDIWGDTVNTAARMEQNSEAGKINISKTTYELVRDKFTCESRGEIETKNKGGLKMYFINCG